MVFGHSVKQTGMNQVLIVENLHLSRIRIV
jgi:hypothetical protein